MDIKKRAEELLHSKIPKLNIIRDTSQWMGIDRGDILELQDRLFVVRGHMYEGRFGLDDEPKPWVKTGVDLLDGSEKVIKLVFFEEFDLTLGGARIRRFRSATKESRILDVVRANPYFMHGETLFDHAMNPVRIIERIRGEAFVLDLEEMGLSHQQYMNRKLPALLRKLVVSMEAIGFLHDRGERHGDIRRDHLFVENSTGLWRWIDFDYNYEAMVNPYGLDLFGLGNVLCYVIGAGIPNTHSLKHDNPKVLEQLEPSDMSMVMPHRVFNLCKVYPYLPDELNRVLMHFSAATPVFYEHVDELLAELRPAIEKLPPPEEAAA